MRNQKWVKLAEKLQSDGWGSIDPRFLRKAYFAGRATMSETSEEVGDRTIYRYAIVWSDTQFASE